MLAFDKLLERARQIKLLICDVDGVMTDGKLHYNEQGITFKSFHVHDGFGLQLLMQLDIQIAVITTCKTNIIKTRLQQLGVPNLYQGVRDKLIPFNELATKFNLTHSQIAYIGDDLPDLPLIEIAGLGIAVANAAEVVKQQAAWITQKNGGSGAVREVCDVILEAQQGLLPAFNRWREQR